ncbi:MAG: ParB-like nuclease domain-containing protein [Candidatus Aminicenantes bacterium]|nr:ParB-like nuclease domain-containing protein [Candidatus Aminicenantes bacterium]
MDDILSKTQSKLKELTQLFKELGLAPIMIINPSDCIPQNKNARYFQPEVFEQLVKNIKDDKRLESVPLVYHHPEINGKYIIISGHHRIDAAKQAKLEFIIVMVIKPESNDEIIAKQLSHNSLVGKDDQQALKELFEEIKSIESKIASGVESEISKVDFVSINFTPDMFQQLILLFLPEEIEKFDNVLKQIEERVLLSGESTIRVVPGKIYDKFADSLRTIKKKENIKSNAAAFTVMVEIVAAALEDRYKGDGEKK